MKSQIISVFLLISTFCYSQHFNFGLSTGFNRNYHQVDLDDFRQSTAYQPAYNTFGGEFGLIFQYVPRKNFGVQIAPSLMSRQISFRSTQTDISVREQDNLKLQFYAVNLKISGKFDFPFKSIRITPDLGLNLSFNRHMSTSFTDNSNEINTGEIIIQDITSGESYASREWRFIPGIYSGVGIGKVNSRVKIAVGIIYSPLDFFENETFVPFISRDESFDINGKSQILKIDLTYLFGKI